MASQQFIGNLRQSPVWLKDFANREHIQLFPAKLDAAQFTDAFGVAVTVASGASQSAITVSTGTLSPSGLSSTTLIAGGDVVIPNGTNLFFGGAKIATLTADAKIGDTGLTVAALPTALVTGDTAIYSKYGMEAVAGGTLLGRTYAERDAFTNFGPAAATDDEIFLLAWDRPNVKSNNDVELVRHGSIVAENLLPNYATYSTATNEVQTVAVDTILSGGKIGFTATDKGGVPQSVLVAYNTSWTQTVADIATALNAQLGTSAVATAVTNTHDMTITFSGTGYANTPQSAVGVDISAATGPTKATVSHTTLGGPGGGILALIRKYYRCIVAAQ